MSRALTGSSPSRPRVVKLAETVARSVVDEIVARGRLPGEPLAPEAEMADHFGVSRATVREALRILETHGLVVLKPGRNGGPQVGEVDPVTFARSLTWFLQMRQTRFWEVLEARVLLEPMMAALAARRRDADGLRALAATLEDYPEDDHGYLEATQRFHGVIAGISGNAVLDLFGRSLKEVYTGRVVPVEQPAARRELVLREHREVAEAVMEGDPDLAEDRMREHMVELSLGFERRYRALGDEFVGWW
ncbi:hypothetical protein GCM10025768_01490 [Microbacterium pseudoresistens]|uniref:DNA-binding FadR family transcriptional regulator n=1 Tax=Microbacterium pseudoresistens TaxID=640634 RepID=A0A7Y9EU32_9MICO|nr:DNA-binding FadR family transcriptional regulator [Microbacterium pseudoresistens]